MCPVISIRCGETPKELKNAFISSALRIEICLLPALPPKLSEYPSNKANSKLVSSFNYSPIMAKRFCEYLVNLVLLN